MVPITAAGRTIACLLALCGAATVGMLVSVLVDRYQRVYNRKMYISEPEMSSIDLDLMTNPDDDIKSPSTLHRSSRMHEFSEAISQGISSLQGKRKHYQHRLSLPQAYNLQFVVSFNNNNKDDNATDHIVSIMKKKLTEVISNTNIDVDLKLIDNDSQELWAISSGDSSTVFNPYLPRWTDNGGMQPPKIQFF